jgi:hypothetical protein
MTLYEGRKKLAKAYIEQWKNFLKPFSHARSVIRNTLAALDVERNFKGILDNEAEIDVLTTMKAYANTKLGELIYGQL